MKKKRQIRILEGNKIERRKTLINEGRFGKHVSNIDRQALKPHTKSDK